MYLDDGRILVMVGVGCGGSVEQRGRAGGQEERMVDHKDGLVSEVMKA